MLSIREIGFDDSLSISTAFSVQGWDKPAAQFERYYEESQNGLRMVDFNCISDGKLHEFESFLK